MPRVARPSLHLVARVRAWFGLRQAELALFLGISPNLVQGIESGRRTLTPPVHEALLPLLPHLPPEGTPTEAVPPGLPAAPPPEVAALDLRRRECRQQAARLRTQAEALAREGQVAARWARALPALLAAVPTAPAEAERATWLRDWLGRQARPLPAAAVTRYHLLRARATALEAEAAALAEAIADAL
jgi:transcriptional regulator with XRE-family HTH domain